jgi:hypothetical protein
MMSERVLSCDIAVIGGSLGGVAAALAAASAGKSVVLTEATDWLGGQITSQGVAALDEHAYIETFGGTRTYYALRSAIRAVYRDQYQIDMPFLNPGNSWASRLCFEPRIGLQVIETLLAPHRAAGLLTVLLAHVPVSASAENDTVREVTLQDTDGNRVRVEAAYFLDATDLGDLLPLAGVEYVTGAEAAEDTGEPHACPDGARPDEVQGFTFSFAVEYRPGTDNTIPKPAGYEYFCDHQPYALTLQGHDGEVRRYFMFRGELPFWSYRRIFDGRMLNGSTDITLINWASNDYFGANLIDHPPAGQARILDEARRLSRGFLYWLQTAAPRDEGGQGYPELYLRPDVMGTPDGLAKAPYIRESRRLLALRRVVEQDIIVETNTSARARLFTDSVGIGWYAIDIHACVGNPDAGMYAPTRPFQIPLGALMPRRVQNVIAACKNIGTTHLTNGAYRLHPVEWNIGESAGMLAVFCCEQSRTPHEVWSDISLVRRFQMRLLRRGVPLAWGVDVPADHPLFVSTQMLLLHGVARSTTLEVQPPRRIDVPDDLEIVHEVDLTGISTWRELCIRIAPLVEQIDLL